MFHGLHEHTIDDKNRLTLPAKLRDSFADGVVLARGIDGCLDVYTREAWEETMAARLAGLNPFSREARQLKRVLHGTRAETELDRQGRVTVPGPLLQAAGLDRNVVVAGVGDHLEVWDRDAWQAELSDGEGRLGVVAERVAAGES